MKNTTIIQHILDNQSFLDWASTSYDTNHAFCQSDEYKQLDPETLSTVKLLNSSLSFDTPTIDLSSRTSILKNIHKSISTDQISIESETTELSKTSFSYGKWAGIAASFALLIMFLVTSPFKTEVNLETSFAETIQETLPDGSIVNLDANSTLKSVGNWSGGNDRVLELTNDAFFSVTSDPKVGGAAFRVLTETADIEVLGTEFYVENNGTSLRVIVKEGSVKVSPNDKSNFETQILNAGDELVISDGTSIETSILTQEAIDNRIAWKKGEIVFDNTSWIELKDIVKERFNYDLQVTKALETSDRKISGPFPIKTVELLMNSIATSFELQIDFKVDKIAIGYIKKD